MYNSVISELDPTIAAASSLVLVSVTVVVLLPLLIRRKARH
jgi:putative spermidine/putrescine transport system permease protein